MNDLRDLYQQVIIDHNRSPRNFHPLANANCHAKGFNPLCGDKVTVYCYTENDVIQDISFEGNGCAISMASASLMTDYLKGKTLEQAEAIFQRFHDALVQKQEASLSEMGKLAVFSGVCEYPSRVKCATLAWHAVHAALQHQAVEVTSENE